jgi:hypothetical protein
MTRDLMPVSEVATALSAPGLGFQRIDTLPGSTYVDNSTVIIAPTRGMIHHRTVQAWQGLMGPMNQKRHFWMAVGHEVGKAYNEVITQILGHPDLSKWKYILTLEDDNLPPPDAHIRLLESIEWGKYDAISGIYFTKGEYAMPMAYGDPAEYKRTGVLDFRPRDIRQALVGGNVMPVNGIAMGCALWRVELFKQMPPPWFVTLADVTPEGPKAFTQDLFFCEKAVRAGKTFAVDMRVKVGHLDINTGVVY